MGNHHKGGSLGAGQFQHQVKHTVRGTAVQVASGFICQNTGRLRDQRTCNRYPLPFAP